MTPPLLPTPGPSPSSPPPALPPSSSSSSPACPPSCCPPSSSSSSSSSSTDFPSPPLSPPDSPPFLPDHHDDGPPSHPPKRTPSFHLILPLPPPLLALRADDLLLSTFFPPSSAEALASSHILEHIHHDPQIGARMMGLSAAPAALGRYLAGESLYILPQTADELNDVLGRFARDVIHSLISQAKTRIEEGGYTVARHVAMRSLRERVFSEKEGVEVLLAVHRAKEGRVEVSTEGEGEEVRTLARADDAGERKCVSVEEGL